MEALPGSRSSVKTGLDGDEIPAGGAIEDGLEEWLSSLCVSSSGGGSDCVTTEGEADAARSCSSKLTPVMGDGDDFASEEYADFPGCAKGSVDGKGGCCPEKGDGSVASLKCRPLQGKICQWNETTTTWNKNDQSKNSKVGKNKKTYFSMSFSSKNRPSSWSSWVLVAHLSGTSR